MQGFLAARARRDHNRVPIHFLISYYRFCIFNIEEDLNLVHYGLMSYCQLASFFAYF